MCHHVSPVANDMPGYASRPFAIIAVDQDTFAHLALYYWVVHAKLWYQCTQGLRIAQPFSRECNRAK